MNISDIFSKIDSIPLTASKPTTRIDKIREAINFILPICNIIAEYGVLTLLEKVQFFLAKNKLHNLDNTLIKSYIPPTNEIYVTISFSYYRNPEECVGLEISNVGLSYMSEEQFIVQLTRGKWTLYNQDSNIHPNTIKAIEDKLSNM